MILSHATKNGFEINESNTSRHDWISRSYASNLPRDASQADILLVPQEGFRQNTGPVFPVGTEEFFHFLKDHLPSDVNCEICINDEAYREIALHFDVISIASLVVSLVAAPLVVNLITEYVKQRWPLTGKDSQLKVQLSVEHDMAGDRKSLSISYEGNANDFPTAMKAAFDEMKHRGFKVDDSMLITNGVDNDKRNDP